MIWRVSSLVRPFSTSSAASTSTSLAPASKQTWACSTSSIGLLMVSFEPTSPNTSKPARVALAIWSCLCFGVSGTVLSEISIVSNPRAKASS